MHALILPPSLSLPPRTNAWLFLEGESAGSGDAWPDPARKARTIFRTGQVPDDKWWARIAPPTAREWPCAAPIQPPVAPLDLMFSIEPDSRCPRPRDGDDERKCELAFTLGDGLPERPVSNTKSYINWVQVGMVEIIDETRKAQLHVRTRQAAVRADTVLLKSRSSRGGGKRIQDFDVTPPAWRKAMAGSSPGTRRRWASSDTPGPSARRSRLPITARGSLRLLPSRPGSTAPGG